MAAPAMDAQEVAADQRLRVGRERDRRFRQRQASFERLLGAVVRDHRHRAHVAQQREQARLAYQLFARERFERPCRAQVPLCRGPVARRRAQGARVVQSRVA